MTRLLIFVLALLPVFAGMTSVAAQEKVSVRTGTHTGYDRVVVEWPSPVDYTVARKGAELTVNFTKAGNADITAAEALDNIHGAKTVSAPEKNLSLSFTIPADSKIRDLKVGNKIILDVYDPPGGRQKPKADDNKPEAVKETPAPASAKTTEEKPVSATTAAPVAEEKKPEAQAVTTPAPAVTPAPAATPAPAGNTSAAPAIEPHVLTVTATKKFGMALFERGPWLWIITDDPDSVEPTLSGPQAERFGLLQRFDIDGGSAYRLKKPADIGITTEGGGMRWRVVLSPNPKEVTSIVPERLSPVAAGETPPSPRQGSALLWPLTNARSVLTLKDPDIGDTLKVVTAGDSSHAVRTAYRYVELQTLPSYIGLAILPLADDVSVSIADGNVRAGRGEKDISLSMAGQDEAAPVKTMSIDAQKDDLPPVNVNNIYHLSRWEMGGLPALVENQNVLMAGIGKKDEAGQVEDFLTLGKLMLANGRGSEALGYLRMAALIRPEIEENAEYLALRGAAAMVAGQPDLAIVDLSNTALNQYQDVPYWRTATFAALEDWQQAIATMPKDTRGINDYPAGMREHLSLALAEVALRGGQVTEGERILADLEPSAGTMVPADQAGWNYLMGEAARQLKQYEKAKQYWQKLTTGKDDYYRAKAGLALTRLLLDRHEIDPAQAIDRLEGLRYAWRGDELEALVNYRLGQVYVDNNEYLKGFYVLRNAASLSGESHLGQEIADYMTANFRGLFDSDKLQKISPLDAIGVYEEFKELMPPAEEGDRIVEQLAERMVDADLLGRAEGLLDYQLEHRLKGAEAGRIALRVAAIRLLDNKPDGALKNLDMAETAYKESDEKTVPADKQREIALLRASALSKTGRADEAIAQLDALPADKTVARLRADIAWKSQRWSDAADGLQSLIDVEQIRPDRPLSAAQTDLILNRGIALNLAGDRVSLSTLRERYGDLMKQTPKAELFDVVTLPRRFGLIRSRDTIAESINNVDLFKDFLENYRKAEVPTAPAAVPAATAPSVDANAKEVTPAPQAVPAQSADKQAAPAQTEPAASAAAPATAPPASN